MGELWLTYTDGDGTRRRLAVGRDEVVIGRHSESDLVIADSRLSRRHAKIARSGGAFVIEDGEIDTSPWITHRVVFDQMIGAFPGGLKPESGVIKAVVQVA